MPTCILCRNTTCKEPEEHILPEGLVGDVRFNSRSPDGAATHERLVLSHGEICGNCNHLVTAPLDEHLQKKLSFFKVLWNTAGTKKGRPASAIRPGMFARRTPKGTHFTFNMEHKPIATADGVTIPPALAREEGVNVKDLNIDGQNFSCKVTFPFRCTRNFVRAMHKVGFELLCHMKGADYVLAAHFDHVREFILSGRGRRRLLMATGDMEMALMAGPSLTLIRITTSDEWVAELRLGAPFVVDLSPTQTHLDRLLAAGPDGHWFVHPAAPSR